MSIQIANRISEVKTYYFAKKLADIRKMNAAGCDVINLGIGSPDLPPPPQVVEALRQSSTSKDVHGYQSYYGLPLLRVAFAKWYKKHFKVEIDAENNVLPLIGSKEGIMHISMAYLEAGDQVLIPNPGYPAYAATAEIAGAEIVNYNLKEESGWHPNYEEIENQHDLSKVKIMWVNYPHMPTGAKGNRALFQGLIDFGRKHQILICHDNPYAFILNDEIHSIHQIEGSFDTAIELVSLSKCYNMAGWRVGALVGAHHIIADVIKFKSNMDSGMFKPMQVAAATALEVGDDWFQNLNEVYHKRKEIACSIFDYLGINYQLNTAGLFVWGRLQDHQSAFAESDKILEKSKVFITPGSIFGSNGDNYLRISLCTNAERLEEALQRIKTTMI